MGGIAGIYYAAMPKPVDPARVRAMADAQAHRGPDGAGVWTAPGVGLGHRRLAIVDRAGSPQPMTSEDGSLTITLDGEIHNFTALRTELAMLGAQFRTDGDTEVVLLAWDVWGPEMLSRLDGMFAFAIHDARRQFLFLARDRLGVKPLHYAVLADGALAFASELKGLLAHPLLRCEPDIRAVEDYLALGYVPDDACLVAGVSKLPAGHALLVERGRPVPLPRRWWSVDFTNRTNGTARDLAAALQDLLRKAITTRMVADVPVGAFLSGDLDTSAVVAMMSEASRGAVRTCAIGYDDPHRDDRRHAAEVARRFATSHRDQAVAAEDFAVIDTLVAAFDEPFADPAALATFRLCQLARADVTVMLSGAGADEVFAGDHRYRSQVVEERVRGMLSPGFRQSVFGALGRHYPEAAWAPRQLRAKASLLALAEDGAEAYARAVGVTSPALRAALFTDAAKRSLSGHRAEDRCVRTMRDAPARDALDRAQYADLQHWLPGNVLTGMDRIGMAVGLEVRAPLLDHRLVEFAATLPVSMRLRGGQGKWLMRKALERYLPREVLSRPRMRIESPISAWFRGPLADEAMALSRSRMLGATGWFEPATIARIAAEHRDGTADHGRTLWQLLMLDRSMARLFG
jgi:asparagine synthase (glutamine-hydrolysing)